MYHHVSEKNTRMILMAIAGIIVALYLVVACTSSQYSTRVTRVSLSSSIRALDPVDELNFSLSPARLSSSLPSSSLWSSHLLSPNPRALPTNQAWLGVGTGSGSAFSSIMPLLPYIYRAIQNSLEIMFPTSRPVGSNQVQDQFDAVYGIWRVSCSADDIDIGGSGGHLIDDYDVGSVKLIWNACRMMTHLVRGSPYVTMWYEKGVNPIVSSSQRIFRWRSDADDDAHWKDCGDTTPGNATSSGRMIHLEMLDTHTKWMLFTSRTMTISCTYVGGWSVLSLHSNCRLKNENSDQTVIRLAIVNNCTTCTPMHTEYETMIKAHASTIVTGLHMSYDTGENNGRLEVFVNLTWKTTSMDGLRTQSQRDLHAAQQLVHLALPHHMDLLTNHDSIQIHRGLCLRNIRGFNTLIVGSTWILHYDFPLVTWTAPRPIQSDSMRETLRMVLKEESTYDLPINFQIGAGDPYFAGKMLAKLARLVLIAEELGENVIKRVLATRLQNYVSVWIEGKSQNPLIYDNGWGGIVSCGCIYDDCGGKCQPHCNNAGPPHDCPAVQQQGYDFGSGFYDDHHFHYGYHIYAAAVLAHVKHNTSFSQHIHQRVLALVRDIANPLEDDPYFPYLRMMDVYEGHSWASGIVLANGEAFFNGKNQESSSEAVHAWYAVWLYGKATSESSVEAVGAMLLAMETHSAHTYWQIDQSTDIYPGDAFQDEPAVGILWGTLAQCQTWFGGEQWKVIGIQTLPIIPWSEVLLRAIWAKRVAPVFASKCCNGECADQGWQPFAIAHAAIIERDAAWNRLLELSNATFSNEVAGGNGNSRSNMLHFIATRPSVPSFRVFGDKN